MRVLTLVIGLALSFGMMGTGSFAQTTLVADMLRAPEEGGPRRWGFSNGDLELFAAPSVDAEVIEFIPQGTVLANLGCLDGLTSKWCEVRSRRDKRGFVDATRLRAIAGPDGVVAMGVDTSKRRARKRDFDAKTKIACAQERGQSLGTCKAAVARSGGGDATVVVTFPNGFARMLFFTHGDFIRASATMSGVGTDVDWQLTSGKHIIRVDDQRFQIPQTFILGGG